MKKKFYESKTFYGLLISLVAYLFGQTEIMAAGIAFTGYGFRDAMK